MIIEWLKAWLGLDGGVSVWQVLWEIPDAEVLLLPGGRHRVGTSVRRTLAIAHGHVFEVMSHQAGIGRHRVAVA